MLGGGFVWVGSCDGVDLYMGSGVGMGYGLWVMDKGGRVLYRC